MKELGGLETDKDLPYLPYRGVPCKMDQSKFVAHVDEIYKIKSNAFAMQSALLKFGPISVGTHTDNSLK